MAVARPHTPAPSTMILATRVPHCAVGCRRPMSLHEHISERGETEPEGGHPPPDLGGAPPPARLGPPCRRGRIRDGLGGTESAPLMGLRDRIAARFFARQHLGGVHLAVVLRPVAEPEGVRVVVPGPGVA